MTPLNQHAVEQALDAGHLWVLMANKRWWLARRNGRTQTWKTRPGEFRIPVMMGLRYHEELTHHSDIGAGNPQDWPEFVVTSTDPNLKGDLGQIVAGGAP